MYVTRSYQLAAADVSVDSGYKQQLTMAVTKMLEDVAVTSVS
jgi:hypothetical protein